MIVIYRDKGGSTPNPVEMDIDVIPRRGESVILPVNHSKTRKTYRVQDVIYDHKIVTDGKRKVWMTIVMIDVL